MTTVAIIGGSGLTNLKNLRITRREVIRTPYGEPSAPMVFGQLGGQEAVFLPRHGAGHTIPPHEVNYRANIWAIKQTGVDKVIAVNAVGGISPDYLTSGTLVVPDQVIDYTYGRAHTFFGSEHKSVTHVDFTYPYCETLRQTVIQAAARTRIKVVGRGTYGATQGPRFESAAEIRRMERDGADIVGMTGMPEAGLARELELCYASISLVVNPAAGKAKDTISLKEIEMNLETGMAPVRSLLEQVIPLIVQG
ncbi:MAG: methylthioadenosine phosphorylase [Candidatus Muproteobacteria bacterium RIFCSPLOWO2_01_FULL_60_18]|uniref:Probable 6-oxopurine nucleoside phosphorylase n=1 Tax=Candidatus Muproteobacteria bacterium RIFCSPLOWO2_01_FULL_60_18 TaxID=1817768 RepID=A0A1F6U614_9PROT|nr:MAG: methylthioadenosine phosphorylase [Candidatus Muproteobacteria bacterium RIFCSPHIGHO2_01_60_12]OGI52835.1 MAG: methylthioadenosine phosphorylase [Candidatus Muproteobacteria bacterium RIFCSPLOWO2_01_FULL_60_18]